MLISYEDEKGIRKSINSDDDVIEAILIFSTQPQPSNTIMVVRLDVEPYQSGMCHLNQSYASQYTAQSLTSCDC